MNDNDDKVKQEEDDENYLAACAASMSCAFTDFEITSCYQRMVLAVSPMSFISEDDESNKNTSFVIPRTQRTVAEIFNELGPYFQKRAYRMDTKSFYRLHRILFPFLRYNIERPNGAPNGLVTSSIRLAAALHFFAGGSLYNIAVVHGISVCKVYNSVNRVIRAINVCPSADLKIEFPESHDEQLKIANGFLQKSKANFSSCVGAIDGV